MTWPISIALLAGISSRDTVRTFAQPGPVRKREKTDGVRSCAREADRREPTIRPLQLGPKKQRGPGVTGPWSTPRHGNPDSRPSADPVAQPLFRRRRARLDKHAHVLGVVLAKVTDGLVGRAVVPRLRGLH